MPETVPLENSVQPTSLQTKCKVSSGRYTGKYKIDLPVDPRSIAAEYIKSLPSIRRASLRLFDHPGFS
jgi:hypothetical protein